MVLPQGVIAAGGGALPAHVRGWASRAAYYPPVAFVEAQSSPSQYAQMDAAVLREVRATALRL